MSRQLQEKEQEISTLRGELAGIKRQGAEVEVMRKEHEVMKHKMASNDASMDEMSREMKRMRVEEAGKVDKVLMRNLFLGYFQAISSRKEDVASVIGSFLDFNADDYDVISSGRSKLVGNKSLLQHQSISELFVKFLEAESAPVTQQTPLQQKAATPRQIIPLTKASVTKHLPSQQQQHSVVKSTTPSQLPIHLYLQSLQKQQQQQPQNPHQRMQQHFSNHYLQHSFNFSPIASPPQSPPFNAIPPFATTKSPQLPAITPTTTTTAITSAIIQTTTIPTTPVITATTTREITKTLTTAQTNSD